MTTPTAETRASLEETRAELARLKTENDDLRAQLARLGAAVPGSAWDAGDVMARAAQVLALPAVLDPDAIYNDQRRSRFGYMTLENGGHTWILRAWEMGQHGTGLKGLTKADAEAMLRRWIVDGVRP